MKKQFLTALCAGAVCLTAAGCSGGLNGYDQVQTAYKTTAAMQSGQVIATAGYEKGDKAESMITELIFRENEDGSIAYCQTQFDRDNKAVYCEFCDGKTVEHWLIGKGWSKPENAPCDRENPHRYLRLLWEVPEKASLLDITCEPEGDSTRYLLTRDPEWLNQNVFADGTEALEETITLLLDREGKLCKWSQETLVREGGAGTECRYRLEMELSALDSVSEIGRPPLREDFRATSE